jgi:hypothetical protein
MNTTSKGDAFERRVYDYFRTQIEDEQFHVRSSCCKVFHKKGYYSRDRDSEIEFDVSIEIYLPGATEYSEVWLIECKNYSHSVPVNDVEEFFAKVQQVSPTSAKPVMASNAAFQSGALNFAKAKKMGVLRLFNASHAKWELYRSPSTSAVTASEGASEKILEGLTSQQFNGGAFDLYMQSPTGVTNSLWDFADGMLVHSRLSAEQRRAVANPRGRPSCRVPYIGNDELEDKCLRILREIGWTGGEVSLADICSQEQTRTGLQVRMEAFRESGRMRRSALGRISFSPLEILVYRQLVPNSGRERFTLAHELAHHLLSHGKYMAGESCDESDFKLKRDADSMSPDIVRMEYQANVFAACLLMPKAFFIADFRQIAERLHIPNRGYGELYLDGQPCNYRNYEWVTRELMSRYGVSRVATTIRLESLGLLRDVRPQACTL